MRTPLSYIKKKDRLKWAGGYLIVMTLYYLWFQLFYNLVALGELFPPENIQLNSVVRNFLSISMVFMANTLIIFFSKHHINTLVKILLDAILSVVAVVTISVLAKILLESIGAYTDYDWSGIMLNDVIIFLINEGAYLVYAYHTSTQKAKEAERMAIQLQYDVLKSQIDPHFLFNSLNILYSMSVIDTEKTREFILSLSQMYRYILTQHDKQTVKVKEELDFMQSYIDVLKMRYRDSLYFNITGMDNVDEQDIVPFSTQLLIENVTKHNIIQTDMPMTVDIDISPDGLSISNPIRPRKNSTSSRIGLHYISQIYSTHGKQFGVTNDGQTFCAYVPFI